MLSLSSVEKGFVEKKRRPRVQSSRKSVDSDHLVVPECVFGFRDRPVCSLLEHAADVLDLSCSKSQAVFFVVLLSLFRQILVFDLIYWNVEFLS